MENDILNELVRVSPFVALLGVACWMLWKKIGEKDSELKDSRAEVLDAYKESIKVTGGVMALIDTLRGELTRDFKDVHSRLDRIEQIYGREK